MFAAFHFGSALLRAVSARFAGLSAAAAQRLRALRPARPKAEGVADLYRSLVEYTSDPVYMLDLADGFRMVFANQACCRHFGLSNQALCQWRLPDWDPAFKAEDLDVLWQGIRERKFFTLETWHQLSDGRLVPVEVSINHLVYAGREYAAGYFRDISERKRWESALRESEANLRESEGYLRYVLDNLASPVYIKDRNYRYRFANQPVRELFRAEEPVILSATDEDFFDAETVARVRAVDRRVLEQGETVTTEETNQFLADGVVSTYISVKLPLRRPDGSVYGLLGISTDISERKRMENALRESEARFRSMADAAPVLIWLSDTGKGCIWFNQVWLDFTGRSLEQELGDGWVDGVHPDDRARCMEVYLRHFEARQPFRMEYRIRRADGAYRWLLDVGRPRFHEDGTFYGYIGSCIDITDHKEAEASLAQSRRELDTILSLSPDGFVAFDGARRVKYASPAFLRLLGIDESRLIGLDAEGFGEWLCSRSEPQVRERLRAWLRGQLGLGPAPEADPEVLLLELAAPRLGLEARARRNETEAVSAILYFHDITERLEVDRMKSDFLSTAAHELRTPLASVYGFAELLLSDEGHDAEAQREMLEIIFRQSKLISALVNELLDLARIEARQGKDFVFEDMDLCALVRETVSADPEGSQWRWPVRVAVPETPVWVRGDANKLRQAVGNVLSNAYKYSPDGGEIQVSLRHEPGEVVVEIQDHGLGMTPDQAARVCERFYRADRSGRIPGTGLGMSIVKEIVTLHGGHLRIDSQPGAGTAVAIHLPDGLGQQS